MTHVGLLDMFYSVHLELEDRGGGVADVVVVSAPVQAAVHVDCAVRLDCTVCLTWLSWLASVCIHVG